MQNKQNVHVSSVNPSRPGDLLELQAAALEATANAVVITNPKGTVIWVNAAFERLTGYTHAEIVGQSTRMLKSGQNSRALYEEIWRTILDGRVWRGELINRRRDGSLYDEEMAITPVHDSGGEITHFVAIKQNITERKRAEEATRRSEKKFRTLFDSTSDAVMLLDKKGFFDCNKATLAIYGCSTREEFCSRHPADLSPPTQPCGANSLTLANQRIAEAIEKGSNHFEWIHKRSDTGEIFSADVLLTAIELNNKLVVEAVVRDITERIKAEERLRLWSRVLDQSAEGIFICDPQERILIVNKAFEEMTGFSSNEAVGKTPRILQSGRQDRGFYIEMWKSVSETGNWSGEMWNRRKSGELFVEWLSVSAVHDQKGVVTHYVGIFSDITVRKQVEERMVHLAHYDALTDLPNRALLMDRLNQLTKAAQRRKSKVAVIFIDLDRFKEVNDSLGHAAGDLLLQTLAKRFSNAVRGEDTLARMGGDEFVAVIQSLHQGQDAAIIAKTLLSCVTEPVTLNGYEHTITASMGISVYPDDATDGQEMIRNADAAMYQAKDAGRNTYQFYTSDLNQRALEMLSTENALRRAIERHEFVLHYQPQFDIASGSIVGAEALIRWNHPDLGLLTPGKFIPIAEERGLIVPIGSWVIEEAARQAAVWQSAGILITMAVNVSGIQFRQRDFEEQLVNGVRKHGITPNRIELELTESIIMRDAEATVEKLGRLHAMGFQLSIDDFGTGYSSLSYLRRFPIDKIKIDQSFVMDEGAGNIVTAVIGLARSLKLKVIAEGVETKEQLEILREQGCDEAQGFLFSPALASGEFEKLIREWKPNFPALIGLSPIS